jgi:hypothetical protein
MGTVFDFLPDHKKQAYIDERLRPGQVVYLSCEFTNPPKPKYLVVACLDTGPLLLVINSEIHPYIAGKPELKKCQVKLRASDYSFLDHDSFVNCAEVIDSLSEAEIRKQIVADVGRMKGQLNQTTKEAIITAVKGAKSVSRYHKKLISNALK